VAALGDHDGSVTVARLHGDNELVGGALLVIYPVVSSSFVHRRLRFRRHRRGGGEEEKRRERGDLLSRDASFFVMKERIKFSSDRNATSLYWHNLPSLHSARTASNHLSNRLDENEEFKDC